jgi:protein-tyrosine phosphatase
VEAVLSRRAAGRSVLLHCLAGVNRAPTVAAAVLCRRDGVSVADALARVRASRPAAAPTPEQVASLRAWLRTQPDQPSDVASSA